MAQVIFEECLKIMRSKSEDYATETDVFSNYNLSAQQAQISPERVCLVRISEKMSRLGVLLAGREPNHESIEDNMLDVINTAANMLMIYRRRDGIDLP